MVVKKTQKKNVKKASAKKSGKNKSPNLLVKYWQRYTKVFIFVLVAIAGIGVWFVTDRLPAIQEKRDLVEKHQKLEEIADKISSLNMPDKRESSRSCGYQSAKFGKGDLYCTTETTLTYGNIDVKKANQVMQESSIAVGSKSLTNAYSAEPKIFPEIYEPTRSRISQDIEDLPSSCGVSYNYPHPFENSKSMTIFISCTKARAKAEHFPIEK